MTIYLIQKKCNLIAIENGSAVRQIKASKENQNLSVKLATQTATNVLKYFLKINYRPPPGTVTTLKSEGPLYFVLYADVNILVSPSSHTSVLLLI